MLSFNPYCPSIAFSIEIKHDLQCKSNDYFYVKYKLKQIIYDSKHKS